MTTRVLVTGGAGFIGSALVRHLVLEHNSEVCTVDKLTYSGSLDNLVECRDQPRHQFRTDRHLRRRRVCARRFWILLPMQSCISLRRRMSIVRSTARVRSFRRISLARISCSRSRASTRPRSETRFASCTYRRTRSTAASEPQACSLKTARTGRTRRIQHRRRRPIISRARGSRLTVCRCSSPTVRTTTARFSFRKS